MTAEIRQLEKAREKIMYNPKGKYYTPELARQLRREVEYLL